MLELVMKSDASEVPPVEVPTAVTAPAVAYAEP